MSSQMYFEPDQSFSSKGKGATPPSTFTKPSDDFTTPPSLPHTLFYLAIIKPHLDTHEIIGPVKKFLHLLPKVEEIVSNSPSAIDKLEELRVVEDFWGEKEKNLGFEEKGFGTFVVEGQRGVYTVLQVLRETSKEVFENLPAPVYTIIASGPLVHAARHSPFSLAGAGKPMGCAATTRLIGSFVERNEARTAAQQAMAEMTGGKAGVKRTETWEAGSKGGGLLMAMTAGQMWEVKIVYEDEALKRAREGFEREGETVGWRF